MDLNLKNTTYKQLLWIGMAPLHCFLGLTSAVIVRSSESGWQIYLC